VTRTIVATLIAAWLVAPRPRPDRLHFVFTSDAHYGLHRTAFRGASNVDASVVNRAMVARMNELASARFPADGGVDAEQPIGAVDFVAEGGDIANRAEDAEHIQRAAASWKQFEVDYIRGLTLRAPEGRTAALYLVPGNHDASNAVGFVSQMTPPVDNTSMIEIFNRMIRPAVPKTTTTFNYQTDRVIFANEYGGVRFIYAQIWLDSSARAWIDRHLERVPTSTPVIVIMHDQPDPKPTHFINPNGNHGLNKRDGFENLLADQFADGPSPAPSVSEQRDLERFLGRHRNIVAWFHGDSNWNEFYTWRGPDGTAELNVFRVDSPMKGRVSAADERKLSFQVAAIDPASRTLTVRECLWNADPDRPSAPIVWGAASTVSLAPAAALTNRAQGPPKARASSISTTATSKK
jgi:hypothetical protein